MLFTDIYLKDKKIYVQVFRFNIIPFYLFRHGLKITISKMKKINIFLGLVNLTILKYFTWYAR